MSSKRCTDWKGMLSFVDCTHLSCCLPQLDEIILHVLHCLLKDLLRVLRAAHCNMGWGQTNGHVVHCYLTEQDWGVRKGV